MLLPLKSNAWSVETFPVRLIILITSMTFTISCGIVIIPIIPLVKLFRWSAMEGKRGQGYFFPSSQTDIRWCWGERGWVEGERVRKKVIHQNMRKFSSKLEADLLWFTPSKGSAGVTFAARASLIPDDLCAHCTNQEGRFSYLSAYYRGN